jgi:hypothetical protein
MFVLAPQKTTWTPVVWPSLDEDGNQQLHRLEFKVKLVSREEVLAAYGVRAEEFESLVENDFRILRPLLLDVRGLKNEQGADLSLTDDVLRALLNIGGFYREVSNSYLAACEGEKSLRAKNFAALAVSGQQADKPESAPTP